jgi:hypothetical protein
MENVSETIKSSKSDKMGFFEYVFNFDDENKNTIMNMLQYTILSIIPVILILKLTKHIFPEEDDTKGSLEITAESIGQLLIIILGIWFTNKIIQFIPTYSGEAYHKFNEITFILPFMIILATMQTKLGAKFNILTNRVLELWTGKSADGSTQQNNGVRVSQPFAGQTQPQFHQPSQADHLDINQILPRNTQLTAMPQQQQQKQDFNQMYQNQPMGQNQGMSQNQGMGQSMTESFEPMAANGALGGMFGSSW